MTRRASTCTGLAVVSAFEGFPILEMANLILVEFLESNFLVLAGFTLTLWLCDVGECVGDEMDIKPPVDNQLPEVNSRQLPGSFGGPLPPDLDQQPSMLSGGSAPHVAGAGQQQTAHMVGARGGQQQAPYMADAGQQQAAHMMGAGGGQQQAPHMVGAGAYQQTQKGSAMLVESPFIHQHSQIFVFSTDLANKAAGAVYHGLCKSIVDFHVQQPGMRELLLVSFFQ